MKTKRQRILAVVLAVITMLTCCSIFASAADGITASGTAGENTTWTMYSSGLLEFKGTGTITEKLTAIYPWCTYNKSVTSVSFAEGITNIPANIFNYNGSANAKYYANLTGKLVIPSTVTEIGDKAFFGVGITSLIFANGSQLKKIGAYAFGGSVADCNTDIYLENYPHSWLSGSVVLPSGLTEISNGAFNNCLCITDITLPANLKAIGDYAFANCFALQTNLVIPDSVTSIGKNAFYHCNSLKALTLGKSVKTIGAGAFYSCEKLTGKLTIPASVETIGYGEDNTTEVLAEDGAFAYCTGITELEFAANSKISSIGRFSFLECSIPDSTKVPAVKYLGLKAFYPHNVSVTVNSQNKAGSEETETVASCAHVIVNVEGTAPTCTTAGMSASSYCSVCGETIAYQVILEKLGHDYVAVNTVAPTCASEGYTEYRCTRCNDTKKADTTSAVAHTPVKVAGKAATCTSAGTTESTKCAVCGKTIAAAQKVSATGHTYSQWVKSGSYKTRSCINCGATQKKSLTLLEKLIKSYIAN